MKTKLDFEIAGRAAFSNGTPMMPGASWQANAFNGAYTEARDARPVSRALARLQAEPKTAPPDRRCYRDAAKVRRALVARWTLTQRLARFA